MTQVILLFCYLQVLDFLTTALGLRVGASEASPFIRWLMTMFDPMVALALSKSIAFGLLGLCVALGRYRLIRWMNYWFSAIVLSNIAFLLYGVMRHA